jgi:hypothetical protein
VLPVGDTDCGDDDVIVLVPTELVPCQYKLTPLEAKDAVMLLEPPVHIVVGLATEDVVPGVDFL